MQKKRNKNKNNIARRNVFVKKFVGRVEGMGCRPAVNCVPIPCKYKGKERIAEATEEGNTAKSDNESISKSAIMQVADASSGCGCVY